MLEKRPELRIINAESRAYVANFSKAMAHAVDALCDSEKYDHFGPHMREVTPNPPGHIASPRVLTRIHSLRVAR